MKKALYPVVTKRRAGAADPIGDTLRANAVAYWKLDEASGARADSTGNGLGLTPLGTVSGAAGKVGNAASLTRAGENGLFKNSTAAFDGDQISVAFWVKFDSITEGEDQTIIWRMAETSKVVFHIAFHSGLWLDVYEDSAFNNETAFLESSVSIAADTWYFVVAEIDRTNEVVRLRINATQEQDMFFDSPTAPTGTSSILSIGSGVTPVGAANTAGFHTEGLVDEVGWWDRLLTTPEKDHLYNAGVGRSLY